MIDVFLIHGTEGKPEDNWFPWLKNECEEAGCKVICPRFPTPTNQSLTEWTNVFKKEMKYVNKNSMMVGHSLGCAFILRIIEKLEEPIKACMLVAGFTEKLGIEKFDTLNESFLDKEFDWERIKKNCRSFYVFYSNNDPYVPQNIAEKVGHKLNAETFLIRGAGHFNTQSDYNEFPVILNRIKEECKK